MRSSTSMRCGSARYMRTFRQKITAKGRPHPSSDPRGSAIGTRPGRARRGRPTSPTPSSRRSARAVPHPDRATLSRRTRLGARTRAHPRRCPLRESRPVGDPPEHFAERHREGVGLLSGGGPGAPCPGAAARVCRPEQLLGRDVEMPGMAKEPGVLRGQEPDDASCRRRFAAFRGIQTGDDAARIPHTEPAEPPVQELAMALEQLEPGQAAPEAPQSLELFVGEDRHGGTIEAVAPLGDTPIHGRPFREPNPHRGRRQVQCRHSGRGASPRVQARRRAQRRERAHGHSAQPAGSRSPRHPDAGDRRLRGVPPSSGHSRDPRDPGHVSRARSRMSTRRRWDSKSAATTTSRNRSSFSR